MTARALGVACLLALAPARGWAQSPVPGGQPIPPEPQAAPEEPAPPEEPPPPEQPAAPEGAPGNAPQPRWLATIALVESYSTNPTLSATDIQPSWVSAAEARLSYIDNLPRGSVSLSADGGAVGYSGVNGLNDFVFTLDGAGTWKATPHLVLSADQSFGSTYTLQTQALLEAGQVLPQGLVHTVGTTLSGAYRLSQKTSLTLVLNYVDLIFPRGQLVGASETHARAGIERELSRGETLSLTYTFSIDVIPNETSTLNSVAAAWKKKLARRWDANASVGVTRFVPYGSTSQLLEPVGAVGVGTKTTRWTFEGHYSRSVGQAYGLGQQTVADLAGVTAAFKISKTLSADVAYTRSWNDIPDAPILDFNDDLLRADLLLTLPHRLVAASAYSFTRALYPSGVNPLVSGSLWTMSLSYGKRWR